MAKRDIPDETWAMVRQDWEAGTSGAKCADKHGVSRGAIQARIAKEAWQRDPLLQEAVKITASAKLKAKDKKTNATRSLLQRAAESAGASAGSGPADNPVERIARDRVQLIEDHQTSWDGIYDLRQDAFRILRGEMPKNIAPPITEDLIDEKGQVIEKAERMTMTRRLNWAAKIIAIFEADARAMMTAQEGERRAYGFDYKTQLVDSGVDEDGLRRRRELASSVIGLITQLKSGAQPAPPEHPPETPA